MSTPSLSSQTIATHCNSELTPLPPSQTDKKTNLCALIILGIWSHLTYPIRFIHVHLNGFCLYRLMTAPVAYVYNKIIDLADIIQLKSAHKKRVPDIPMSNDKLNQMKAIYFRLGTGKIIEGMEKSFFDNYGPYVFDRGLHGGAIEPGFKRSWERAAHFLSYQFQRKVNAKLYLELHAYACDHFMGALNGVLMDQSKIGTFRDSSESAVIWTCSATPDGIYVVTDEAEQALNEMNQEIQARFNTTLGTFDRSTPGKIILRYTTMDKETVAKIYNYFADTMYRELERAQTEDDKFTAICKFFRNCEWLHSVRDGCGRCDLLIFNFLLTQNGFHPTCCNSPYLANTIGLEGWKTYVREGMQTWSLLKSG